MSILNGEILTKDQTTVYVEYPLDGGFPVLVISFFPNIFSILSWEERDKSEKLPLQVPLNLKNKIKNKWWYAILYQQRFSKLCLYLGYLKKNIVFQRCMLL